MDRKDFDRLLAQGGIPSVLLFEGEEEHMKQTALDALQKKLLPEGLEELNRAKDGVKCEIACGFVTAGEGYDFDEVLREADRLMYENKASIKKEMLERGETVHYRQ
jgi:PleD family two-component response regulator